MRITGTARAFCAVLIASALGGPAAGVAAAQTATIDKVQAAIPRIEAMAREAVEKGLVPGLAIGIVFGNEVVYLGGFGVREVGRPDKVDADTVFQLASFSKPIAATVVAALVSDGAVSWDSKIADLDPLFRLHDPYPSEQVTVRDLFAHRSGLPGAAGNELEAIGFDRTEILHRLRLVPPESSFRSGYSYSNFGITAGAVAAAAGAGYVWEEAAEEKLYEPLGMTSTSSRHSDFLTRANRAALHVMVGDAWTAKVTRDPDAQSPAGGVSSNVRDLVKWLTLEINSGRYDGRQLISKAAIGATHEPVIVRGKNHITGATGFYALGWDVDYGDHGTVWSHAGAFSAGTRTLVSILPGEELGIVVLANAFPTGLPEAIADAFYDTVLDGAPSRDWIATWNGIYDSAFGPKAMAAIGAALATPPAEPAPALPLAAYAATYANGYVGDAVVTVEGAGLVLALGPDGAKRYPLRHFDRDTFVYSFSPEIPEVLSSAVFAVGPDQKAAALTLDDFNAGDAVLPRKGE
ncbi:MAG TPA: serine hydrolase [Bauldia sp.]|nr:serine hydrolase [Bauldia sp.]